MKIPTLKYLIDNLGWANLANESQEIFRRLYQLIVPLPYKSYTALLNQSSTAVPTAKILENSLASDVTFSRQGFGIYRISSAAFNNVDKVHVNIQEVTHLYPGDTPNPEFVWFTVNPGYIEIQTTSYHWSEPDNQFWINLDDRLLNTPIEIKVYD